MLSPLVRIGVALLLAAGCCPAAIPDPAAYFGHPIGADRELLDWAKVVSYFQSLPAASDKIRVQELGKTAGGRPFIAATIGSPETIRNLDRYIAIQAKLADPRHTPEVEAEKLIAEGKTVVLITCSIHATEVASTHSAIQFVYNLLTEDKPRFRAILDNTILLLVPSLNPDGVDIVTAWYRQTLNTRFEGTAPPELWHKYLGHDNNRDWYVFSQPETRLTVSMLHNVWHPQIVYDVHQQGPFASRIFFPPWLDPIDPNIDPLLMEEDNAVGMSMAADLTASGRAGVVVNAMYDFWTPARHYQAYHGGMRILSESASALLASPMTVRPDQIATTALGYNPRERSWNYLDPWLGGTWRLGDIVHDQLVAFESCLYQAAIHRPEMLRAFYEIGKRQSARTMPYAFVIPREQNDPGAAQKMLQLLSFGQVEVERTTGPLDVNSRRLRAGSYVIRMQQPYSGYAKTLLERQHYPDLRYYPGGPPKRPYDVTAQTLPLLMGVDVMTADEPFTAVTVPASNCEFVLDRAPEPKVLAASDVDSWRVVNQHWRAGETVWRNRRTGDFSLRSFGNAELGVLRQPKIGLYQSWIPAMDEGWTRWLFEDFGFAYARVHNADIAAGGLHGRFDVIVFPDQSAASIREGYKPGAMPPQFVGGLNGEGAANLREFAESGGTIVFLNHSTEFALQDLGVKLTDVVRGVAHKDFYSPGSLLNVTLDDHDPLTFGVPRQIAIWNEGSPAWEQVSGSGAQVVARYPATDVLASGWLLGAHYLENRAALVNAPAGSGHIILFGMRPQYRAQSYCTFKLFFNSLVLASWPR